MNIQAIEILFKKACEEAFTQVKHEAKVHIWNNDHVHGFTMCMGTYFFTDVNKEILHNEKCSNVETLINEFDSDLKITGNPVSIDKVGNEIYDW